MDNILQAGESVNELVKEVYRICKDKKHYKYFRKSSGMWCWTKRHRDCKPIYIIEARKQYDEERNFFIDFDGNPITENYNLTASEVCEKLQRIPDGDAYLHFKGKPK